MMYHPPGGRAKSHAGGSSGGLSHTLARHTSDERDQDKQQHGGAGLVLNVIEAIELIPIACNRDRPALEDEKDAEEVEDDCAEAGSHHDVEPGRAGVGLHGHDGTGAQYNEDGRHLDELVNSNV